MYFAFHLKIPKCASMDMKKSTLCNQLSCYKEYFQKWKKFLRNVQNQKMDYLHPCISNFFVLTSYIPFVSCILHMFDTF